MSSYLTAEQVSQLLKPINPKRVGKDGKNFSHVEAYDVRAHLTRIFGFGRWSTSVSSLELVFESGDERTKDGKKWTAWTVCYRAVVSVTVCAPDGTPLATYEDGATGEAKNQPSRGDAHDLAMKTALSQALKRAAVNCGDQYGLSLYQKGSTNALVGRVLVTPESNGPDRGDAEGNAAAPADVDSHITEPLPPENAEPEPAPEPRERNGQPSEATDPLKAAEAIRDTLQAVVAVGGPDLLKKVGELMKAAQRAQCLAVRVDNGNGEQVALKVQLEQALRGSRAA